MSQVPKNISVNQIRGMVCCAVYGLVLFTATHVSLGHVREHDWYLAQKEYFLDKLMQFGAYGLFTTLVGITFIPVSRDPSETVTDLSPARLWKIGLIMGLFATIDELTQPLFGRTFELADCVANVMGIAFGLVAFVVIHEARSYLED